MGHSRPRWKNAQRKSGQEDKGDAIPDELLGLVFLRLTSPLDLVRAAFACRSWRKVIAAEDFRVLSARHGAPSSIVAGHYHISFSHCHYRPSGLLPHFVPSSSSCWAGVAANNLALDFLPRAPNGDLSLELADSRGGLLLLADFDHTEHGKPFEQPSRLVVCDPLAGQYVTVPPPPAVSHTTFVSLFLGAALHGEDAAARISLSNYRVTSFTFRRRRSASAAAAMPRRGSSYRYGGVSSSGYRSVRARPKLRYFLLGTAPTIGSAGLGAFTPSLFHAQVFEMFLALFNTGSNLST
ncbi:hypothetical protein QYE76_065498 [Lolium multiflorum]|uniref:F-box domain-containing protein n=1 Tax=Lolium multiflorum TaxID=4521 RepID=A0AAD8S9T1_LOLMU|nr:hypothetical protein QYE76_065498 [Lolium multiflorum]